MFLYHAMGWRWSTGFGPLALDDIKKEKVTGNTSFVICDWNKLCSNAGFLDGRRCSEAKTCRTKKPSKGEHRNYVKK